MTYLADAGFSVLIGAVAALAFGVLFNAPRRALGGVALAGAVTLLVQWVGVKNGLALEIATFLAAVALGVLAQGLARWLAMPALVFTTTGFIPLVPGVSAYMAVAMFAEHNIDAGISNTVTAVALTIAIAGGLGLVDAVIKSREAPIF